MVVESQTIQRLQQQNLDCEANINNAKTSIKLGKKYAKVDIGTSGRYMVEVETGNIFGIKGYGQVHKGHFYGTLDTINEYFWGGYCPEKVVGQPLASGRYSAPALTLAPSPEPKTVLVNGVKTILPEGYHVVKSCVSGLEVVQAIDTPLACDVSHETYHCM